MHAGEAEQQRLEKSTKTSLTNVQQGQDSLIHTSVGVRNDFKGFLKEAPDGGAQKSPSTPRSRPTSSPAF